MIVCVFERKYDDPVYHYSRRSRRIYRIAMLSYPTILGVQTGAARNVWSTVERKKLRNKASLSPRTVCTTIGFLCPILLIVQYDM